MTGRAANMGLGRIDWTSVGIYLALVLAGWLNIYAAVYSEGASGILDMSQRSGMQFIWICISLFVGLSIMLIDDKYYHIFAWPAYWISIAVLVGVLFFGRVVNGARAWIVIGSIAVQPVELVKFTTALALARYMSRYTFSIHRLSDVIKAMGIIMLPVLIVILQNDAGSGLVYAAFFVCFYREGLNGWFFSALLISVVLFIFSLILTPFAVLAGLIVVCVLAEALINNRWRQSIVYLSWLAIGTIAIYFGSGFVSEGTVSLYLSLLTSSALSLIGVGVYAYRSRLRSIYHFIIFFISCVLFTAAVDHFFDNVLQVHQQKRILNLLGLETDLVRWGYNVNQSKIAIGSGGLTGKGFLNGTQTQFNFVPEQSTDFIFSTLGEEWGFVGTATVTVLFCILILRLYRMGERQKEAFGRIYCYGVASLFFFHVVVNIGMTIGIMPVIGIPLPFFSYGGSSMLAFTILFFVAVKLDSRRSDGALTFGST